MSKLIPLTKGKSAIVDDEDYEWLIQWKWQAYKIRHMWYAVRFPKKPNGKGTTISMHREILGKKAARITDHLNRNGLDNRRENLKPCIHQANAVNTNRKGMTSRYFGVCASGFPIHSWEAQVWRNKRRVTLGTFQTECEAALAYNAATFELYGAEARLNDVTPLDLSRKEKA